MVFHEILIPSDVGIRSSLDSMGTLVKRWNFTADKGHSAVKEILAWTRRSKIIAQYKSIYTYMFNSFFLSLISHNRFRLSICKSIYLLMKLNIPGFTQAVSWYYTTDCYNNQTLQKTTHCVSHRSYTLFCYLMHLSLGMKYAE